MAALLALVNRLGSRHEQVRSEPRCHQRVVGANMRRPRIWLATVTALLLGAAVLLGGVLGTGGSKSGTPPRPAAAQPGPPPPASGGAGRDRTETSSAAETVEGVREPLADLLAGFSTGDTPAYTRTLEERIAANPEAVDAHVLLGLAYQQLARETGDPSFFSLSEQALERARELEPAGLLAPTGLATLAVARHDFAGAADLAHEVLRIDPENATARAALGDALLNLGRHDEAFSAYERAAELAPGVATYARVAHARQLIGRPWAATQAVDLALELETQVAEHFAWTLVQRGNLAFGLGKLARAVRAYEAALAYVPDYVHARAALARVDAARGNYDRAIEQYRSVVDRLPAPAYAVALAETLAASGRDTEADDGYALVDAIQRLYEANGVSTELQTALLDLDRDRGVEGALVRAQAAFAEAPSTLAEDVLAWALYRNDRCAEARIHSGAALSLGTRDALMFFHRAMIERCLGREAAAIGWFERALATNEHFSLRWAPVARKAVA